MCAVPGEVDAEFRVRVSLERYFSDERARCYMSCSGARAVRSLARRLRRTFGLPRPFALLSRGHLLPPAEPLALLRHDDPVEVIPTKYAMPKLEADKDHNTSSPEITVPWSAAATSPLRCTSPSVASPPPPPCVPAEREEPGGALADVKRRALDLLDQYSGEAPPRRRRRVRRRRAPRLSAPTGSPGAVVAAPPPDLAVGTPGTASSSEADVSAPAVLRNGAASPRPARLVRALPSPAELARPLPSPAELTRPLPSPAELARPLPSPAELARPLSSPAELARPADDGGETSPAAADLAT